MESITTTARFNESRSPIRIGTRMLPATSTHCESLTIWIDVISFRQRVKSVTVVILFQTWSTGTGITALIMAACSFWGLSLKLQIWPELFHQGPLFIVLMIDHPVNAIPIGKLAKIGPKEHILQRHGNRSTRRQRIEQPLGLLASLRLDTDMHIVARCQVEAHLLRRIGAHEDMPARYRQLHMQDHMLNGIGHRGIIAARGNVAKTLNAPAHKFRPEHTPVEFERLFRIPREIEIGCHPGLGPFAVLGA